MWLSEDRGCRFPALSLGCGRHKPGKRLGPRSGRCAGAGWGRGGCGPLDGLQQTRARLAKRASILQPRSAERGLGPGRDRFRPQQPEDRAGTALSSLPVARPQRACQRSARQARGQRVRRRVRRSLLDARLEMSMRLNQFVLRSTLQNPSNCRCNAWLSANNKRSCISMVRKPRFRRSPASLYAGPGWLPAFVPYVTPCPSQ